MGDNLDRGARWAGLVVLLAPCGAEPEGPSAVLPPEQACLLLKTERDSPIDGVIDHITLHTYDVNGFRIETTWETAPIDGTPDGRNVYTNDADGRVLVQEAYGEDGLLGLIATHTYDADGHRILSELDTDLDGDADLVETFTYDALGHLVRWEWDLMADDYSDFSEVYTYDEDGHLLTEARLFLDGTVNGLQTYTYDEAGHLVRVTSDFLGDGDPEGQDDYTYDAAGNLLILESTNLENGVLMVRWTYTYDDVGRVHTTLFDMLASYPGFTDYLTTITYDADGNAVVYESDTGVDGSLDLRTTNTWDCP